MFLSSDFKQQIFFIFSRWTTTVQPVQTQQNIMKLHAVLCAVLLAVSSVLYGDSGSSSDSDSSDQSGQTSGRMVQISPLKYQILDRVQQHLQSGRQDRRCHIKIINFIWAKEL